jgi:Potassium-transporting ATPase A subunit
VVLDRSPEVFDNGLLLDHRYPCRRPGARLGALLGTSPDNEQSWQRYASSAIIFSGISFAFTYLIIRIQGSLPLNPQHLGDVTQALSFNTAASFLTNTNWQNYGGETTMSYFSQIGALTVQQFVTPAVGIAAAIALVRGFSRRNSPTIGNFWVEMTRCLMYILAPIAFVAGIIFVAQGGVQTLAGPATIHNGLNGVVQTIARGPIAFMEAIKQLGTNGGGFLNANSATTFENPTGVTNWLSIFLLLCIPFALTYTFGKMVGSVRHGAALLGAMVLIFGTWVGYTSYAGHQPNPAVQAAGVVQATGNTEGKEVRFGDTSTALFGVASTNTSTGIGGRPIGCHRRHQGPIGPGRGADHRRARPDVPRPDDRSGRRGQPAKDTERDRPDDPARRTDHRLPAGGGGPATIRQIRRSPCFRRHPGLPARVPDPDHDRGTALRHRYRRDGPPGPTQRAGHERARRRGRRRRPDPAAGQDRHALGNRMASAFILGGHTEEELAATAQLASLADETPEGRSIVVLAKDRFNIRERDLGPSPTFVPFSATTRMSGLDLDGHQIRKGAAESVKRWVAKKAGRCRRDREAIAHNPGFAYDLFDSERRGQVLRHYPGSFRRDLPAAQCAQHHGPPQPPVSRALGHHLQCPVIVALIPLALRGVKFRPASSAAILRRNVWIYGVGGIITPFIFIKLIDLILVAIHWY